VSRAIGDRAEARVAEYLQRKGYRVVARNWCCRGGELDLVCDDAGTIVFVEVRARRDDRHGAPIETVRDLKRRRLILAAQKYLVAQALHDRPCRFDVVTLTGDAVVEHYEDAFTT
jgi:putative endonuclease